VIANESTVWIEKSAHMMEEMRLRHGPYPAGFTRETLQKPALPDLASELARKAAMRLASIGSNPNDVLIKFGKREHMEMLYNCGALRIQPATYFSASTYEPLDGEAW
jgi:hypothetical protein